MQFDDIDLLNREQDEQEQAELNEQIRADEEDRGLDKVKKTIDFDFGEDDGENSEDSILGMCGGEEEPEEEEQ